MPENKERLKQRTKEYRNRSEVKERIRTTVSLNRFKNDFFKFFKKRIKYEEDLYKTAEDYAEVACGLSGRQKCELEEMIMKEAHEKFDFERMKEQARVREKKQMEKKYGKKGILLYEIKQFEELYRKRKHFIKN